MYNWDLTKMFKDNNEWHRSLNSLKEELKLFIKDNHNILLDGKTLYQSLTSLFSLEIKLEDIYCYAKMQVDANGLDDNANSIFMLAQNFYNEFNEKTSYIDTALKHLTSKKLKEFLITEPELKVYKHLLEEVVRNRKHILSLKEEKLLALSSNIRNASENIFEKLEAIDVKFDDVFDKPLNHSNYAIYLKNKDEKVRALAFNNYHEYFKNHANSISTCLINSIRNDEFIAKIRGYKNALCMELNQDKVDEKVYHNLISSVHQNLGLFHEYMQIKKETNNLNGQHMYDLYLNSTKYDPKITFDEAKEIVIKSVGVLGKNYQEKYQKAFTEHWLDTHYREGKYSGAYSGGTYNSYPYVLLNYEDNFRSVETLAHEMGHSMHSYLSKENNIYPNNNYPILLAEIASNVNELLLFNYILNTSEDKEEKKYILEKILESFKGSIYRQTEFAEFELWIHNKISAGESIGTKEITDYYYNLNKIYYGDNVINDDYIRYECLRIPHFYSCYYVYKYATGLAIAYVFANRILNNEEGSVANYLKFLSSGGKDYPLNILKESGVTLDNKVIDEAFELFSKYLNEYKKLVGEEYGN